MWLCDLIFNKSYSNYTYEFYIDIQKHNWFLKLIKVEVFKDESTLSKAKMKPKMLVAIIVMIVWVALYFKTYIWITILSIVKKVDKH